MPADYTSTARALSLSTSPPLSSPSSEDDSYLPWRHLAPGSRDSIGRPIRESNSLRHQVMNRMNNASQRIVTTWRRMNFWQKVGAVLAAILANLLGIGFLVFTGKVFIWLKPVAEQWEHNPLAYFVLWLCVFFVSFPPLVGWSTFGTVAGYIFGVWKGWLLYASATVLGSTASFIVSRTILSKFVNRLMQRDKRFAALALTLKYDGLKLLCMIRLCPLPYSVCNGAVSTFPTVHPLMYGLATAIITPKLLVPAFIGNRLRVLSEKGGEMSAGSKAVNVCSIIITIAIGIFTGWYIYRRTLARAKELEAQEREGIRRSLEADHAAHRPHHAFSEDPDANIAATTLARDEEEAMGFHDFDDDNVDLVLDDEGGRDSSPKRPDGPYRDEFTDNDSDVFKDGDGPDGETYSLHTHDPRRPFPAELHSRDSLQYSQYLHIPGDTRFLTSHSIRLVFCSASLIASGCVDSAEAFWSRKDWVLRVVTLRRSSRPFNTLNPLYRRHILGSYISQSKLAPALLLQTATFEWAHRRWPCQDLIFSQTLQNGSGAEHYSSDMEAAAAIGTQGRDHPYEMAPLTPYLQTKTDVNGSSSFLSSDPVVSNNRQPQATSTKADTVSFASLQPADGTNAHLHQKSQSDFREIRPALNGLQTASENADSTLNPVNGDTALETPNGSTVSTIFPSASGQKKSTSPIALLQSLSSSSSALDPRATNGAFDFTKYRPRSSIPARLPTGVYAQQCVAAAYACRLNPYALHKKEQEALQDHLCHLHVTVYLNIRNGILRLWTRNPMVSVTKEEAMGCAKDYRWMNLASFAYEWLVRNGYINFGCLEIPPALVAPKKGRRKEGPVIVVIGAGMAGLGCARQLEGLFRHYRDSATSPRVIILEGRRRIGGRIYSHPLRSLQSPELPPGLVPKAEMGAQIIVGFDHGNPLDQIIRGQLALRYHLLRDISTIYDIDGSPVDEMRDAMDERLYNDVLDRSGFYRHKSVIVPSAEGDRELIDSGRDISTSDGLTIRQYEEARAAGTIGLLLPTKRGRRGVGHKTAEIKTTGAPVADLDSSEEHPAALTCQMMGWRLNSGFSANDTLQLDPIAKASNFQTLGAVMDDGIRQYRRMLPLTPKDMRLLNWHFANLEYANATNVGNLSLSGWDQDMGNEFEGEHSQVIGGYQQVPYGLWSLPTKLDVRTNKIVSKISYDPMGLGKRKTVVHCEDGDSFVADKVVFTGSLGVLKHGSIEFSPPLPDWKQGAIERLGFGVMNKVILVFEKPFWDTERDMFGLLREPTNPDSMAQEDYSANRGRFYLFWNCMKTTGLPVLIALMAGDAAHQAERTPDAEIIAEVTSQLRNVFKHTSVPDPLETIITRWRSDRFTRGSYSYVAAQSLPGDYDLMAQSIGNLHFAGEATCGTHPATVHGAYLSGLRAASEVIESLLGPIELPTPLVPDKVTKPDQTSTPTSSTAGRKRQRPTSTFATAPSPETSRSEAYDQAMWAAVYAEVGPPILRPSRSGLNPFLLYQKDYWGKCRAQCDEARRAATGDPNASAARDEIRHALGLMWRQASEAEKWPYLKTAEGNRTLHAEQLACWRQSVKEWESKSVEVQKRWCAAHPFETWASSGTEEPSKRVATDHANGVGDVVAPTTVPAPAVSDRSGPEPVPEPVPQNASDDPAVSNAEVNGAYSLANSSNHLQL